MWPLKILGNIQFSVGHRLISMLFGHNTNVTVNGMVIHVQTEDRGTNSALIDTTVYHRGRVLHRRTNSYSDLLPLDPDRGAALKIRLDDQHRTVLDELRSGALHVALLVTAPAPAPAPVTPPQPAAKIPAEQQRALSVDLLNPRTWLTGKHAALYLVVSQKDGGAPAVGVGVTARVEGAAEPVQVSGQTNADGHAQLAFDMPRPASEEVALVIDAILGEARGHLRFHLRAKPKVPAAG
jgi:hypothetical protein